MVDIRQNCFAVCPLIHSETVAQKGLQLCVIKMEETEVRSVIKVGKKVPIIVEARCVFFLTRLNFHPLPVVLRVI